MSFPAAGVESWYRNPIERVQRFFDMHYGEHAWIINTSERKYDVTKFRSQVTDYHWLDHHGPPFHYLFHMVQEMYDWLKKDPKNIVAVHCNSGKGRTGTSICAFLLFCGYFDNIDDALKFYGHQRFTCGKGVS